MKEDRHVFRGGIRQRILILLLITIVLIITAYSAIFLYQTVLVEQMVNDTYEAQKQVYIDNGIEDQYELFRTRTIDVFHREMFHARNILILMLITIVAVGMASAYSMTNQIIEPLNTITRRIASMEVRNSQFMMENIYKTGDEIEVLAESFAKQSARTMLYIDHSGQPASRGL